MPRMTIISLYGKINKYLPSEFDKKNKDGNFYKYLPAEVREPKPKKATKKLKEN